LNVTEVGDEPDNILSRGGSCIINPLGQIIAGPNFTEECILTADLDMDEIARGKYDFDVVGHLHGPMSLAYTSMCNLIQLYPGQSSKLAKKGGDT
jgi:hypothetical protein